MNTEELYKKYKDKICILHINSIGERELAWFKKKSEALDFQESGITVVYMLDLKFAKDKNTIIEFLDGLLFEGYIL
jgi:hypothetical protein